MFCTSCGKELAEGTKFCTQCGKPVVRVVPREEQAGAGAAMAPASEEEAVASSNESAEAAEEAAAGARAAEKALWPTGAEDASSAEPTRVMPQQADAAPWVTGASQQPADSTRMMPQQPAPSAPKQASPHAKKPIALIAAIVGIIAVILIGVCVFVLPHLTGGNVVFFGQRDALACSVVTRIQPRDALGNDLTSYVVRLAERTADNMEDDGAPTLGEVISEIRVTGTGGFTFEDFGEIPDGEYTMVIIDGETGEEYYNDIDYDHDQTTANETYIIQPEPEREGDSAPKEEPAPERPTEDQLAYAAYYGKCQELIEQYGEPASIDLYDGQETMLTGLALAELIDFDGDGSDELLTIVCNLEVQDGAIAELKHDGYLVAVWDYQDGELLQVYDRASEFSNGGAYFQYLYEREGTPVMGTSWYGEAAEPMVEEYHSGYFMLEDEAFETAAQRNSFFNYDTGDSTESFAIGGTEATSEQWDAFVAETPATHCYSLLQFNSDFGTEGEGSTMEEVDVYGCMTATDETLDELVSGAGPALEGEGASTDEAGDGQASAAAYAYELIEEDVTFTSSQGVDMEWDETQRWAYPRFTREDGGTDAVLDALNEELQASFEEDREATQAWEFDGGTTQVTVHRDTVTYLEGSIACVRSERWVFAGGAHGNESMRATFYDLSTGERIAVEDACGVSWDTLVQEAHAAIEMYCEQDPNFSCNATTLSEIAGDPERYYATADGIVVCVDPYQIAPYSYGMQLIYVHAFEDESLVGTAAPL